MFENTKTICTPWKQKHIGCCGKGLNKLYSYSPKTLHAWKMQQGKLFSFMKITEKVKYFTAKTCLPLFTLLDDNGVPITDSTREAWKLEWKLHNG
jgi:hypothetical protein